jgi:hypothetical protein
MTTNIVLDDFIEEAIFITYVKATHCFVRGCGKETLMHWVHTITSVWICPKMLRRYMIKLVSKGIFRIYKTAHGYTCFEIKNKGKRYLIYKDKKPYEITRDN